MTRSPNPGSGTRVAALAVLAVLVGALVACGRTAASAGVDVDRASGLAWVDLGALSVEARKTVAGIDAGRPFPDRRDGRVFANREGILPDRPRGDYREYTVPTPGASTRGARRIVAADRARTLYYTDDHYRSFRRIRR